MPLLAEDFESVVFKHEVVYVPRVDDPNVLDTEPCSSIEYFDKTRTGKTTYYLDQYLSNDQYIAYSRRKS